MAGAAATASKSSKGLLTACPAAAGCGCETGDARRLNADMGPLLLLWPWPPVAVLRDAVEAVGAVVASGKAVAAAMAVLNVEEADDGAGSYADGAAPKRSSATDGPAPDDAEAAAAGGATGVANGSSSSVGAAAAGAAAGGAAAAIERRPPPLDVDDRGVSVACRSGARALKGSRAGAAAGFGGVTLTTPPAADGAAGPTPGGEPCGKPP